MTGQEQKIKISELPSSPDFTGLYTLGYKNEEGRKKSVKVSLGEIQQAHENVLSATEEALEAAEQADSAAENAGRAAGNADTAAATATEAAELAVSKAALADRAAAGANTAAAAANTAAGRVDGAISHAEAATTNAAEAAEAATEAAALADGKAALANRAATGADTAADAANTAATLATEKATLASDKAALANTAAAGADTAAAAANTAAGRVDGAISNAEAATTNAAEAAEAATEAASLADEKAALANRAATGADTAADAANTAATLATEAAELAVSKAALAETAAAGANTAAAAANTAAGRVDGAISNAEAATTNAAEAAEAATEAAALADEKAALANRAATGADTAAGNADTAAATATEAATTATEAAALANDKATLADTAAGNANTAADRANRAAESAEGAINGLQPDWNVSDPVDRNYIKNKPEIPTLDTAPDASTLSYVNADGTTIPFRIGDEVRVLEEEEYAFYRLYDLVDGQASWLLSNAGGQAPGIDPSLHVPYQEVGTITFKGQYEWQTNYFLKSVEEDVNVILTPQEGPFIAAVKNITNIAFLFSVYNLDGTYSTTPVKVNYMATTMSELNLARGIAKAVVANYSLCYNINNLAELFASYSDEVVASEEASGMVKRSNIASAGYLCYLAGLDPAGYPDMDSIAGDATAMEAILSQENAREFFFGSNYRVGLGLATYGRNTSRELKSANSMYYIIRDDMVMNQVANFGKIIKVVASSPTAMTEVVRLSSPMRIIAQSSTAMNEVAYSRVAMDKIAASRTAMSQICSKGTALKTLLRSRTARDTLTENNSVLQNLRSTIWNTVKRETGLFRLRSGPTDYDVVSQANVISGSALVFAIPGSNGTPSADKVTTMFHGHNSLEAVRRSGDPTDESAIYVGIGGATFTEQGDGKVRVWEYSVS